MRFRPIVATKPRMDIRSVLFRLVLICQSTTRWRHCRTVSESHRGDRRRRTPSVHIPCQLTSTTRPRKSGSPSIWCIPIYCNWSHQDILEFSYRNSKSKLNLSFQCSTSYSVFIWKRFISVQNNIRDKLISYLMLTWIIHIYDLHANV